MSKQWGHGYWKGVEDARNGIVKQISEDEVLYWISWMRLDNWHNTFSRSLYKVKQFNFLITFYCGYSIEYCKSIYDYIMKYNPMGAFITGEPDLDWEKDSYCLPMNCTEEAAERFHYDIINKLGNKLTETT